MTPLVQTVPPAQVPTPPIPGAPAQVPGVAGAATPQLAPIELLQAREAQLVEQISILRGQRQIVVRQLRARDPVTRSGAPQQLQVVDNQLASAQSELTSLQAQMSLRQPGRDARTSRTSPPFNPRDNDRPGINGDMITGIIITFTIAVLMPLSIGISRRLWRRTSPATTTPDMIAPRLDRLEQAVDAIAIEIERISEGQRFVTKVMTERPPQAQVRHAAIAPAESHDASALGEAKPFLALGAGPIEPIRMAERQAVRQSITPH